MSKKRPDYLRLIVDNGKLINEKEVLQRESVEVIKNRILTQNKIAELQGYLLTLIKESDYIENKLNEIERRENGIGGPKEDRDSGEDWTRDQE